MTIKNFNKLMYISTKMINVNKFHLIINKSTKCTNGRFLSCQLNIWLASRRLTLTVS